MSEKQCTHKDQIRDVHLKDITVCEECVKLGDTWVNLRMCLTCGNVGCRDISKNKHARRISTRGASDHESVSPGEEFTWCDIER